MAYRRNYRKPESNLVQLLAMHPSNEPNAFEPPLAATLVDLLRIRASATGGREAFCFIREDGKVDVSITYGELHQRAMAIAGELQTLMAEGDRALLLYPPGLEFIAAFFGCLYAGVAAVPAALPARNRSTSSVEAILRASNPAVILSTRRPLRVVKAALRARAGAAGAALDCHRPGAGRPSTRLARTAG